MQVADEENQSKSRDEDSIHFRPSPNFKHMKKYLKSKFEEAMMIEARSSRGEPNTLLLHNKREKVNTTMASAPVQPPLPPNPPPPDTPPMIMNVKKEVVDDAYQSTEASTEFKQSDELRTITIKTDQSETPTEIPNVTMCRNFARGTCKKGATCIFAHELILSQLPGVYTFCRNFQNSVCSFPKCKFVHATVFEKEHFFRTGYLPPHTLAHLKEATVVQPPLPPQSEDKPAELPPVYSNAQPPLPIPCIPQTVIPYAENGVERNDIFRTITPDTNSSSPKRDWSETQEASSTTRDLISGETLAKKCKHCPTTEFRYHFASLSCSCSEHGVREQLIKTKVEKFSRSNKELNQKITQLNKKNATLAVVIGALLKTVPTKSPNAASNCLGINGDKDANVLSNTNFTALLAKMLMSANAAQPDAT